MKSLVSILKIKQILLLTFLTQSSFFNSDKVEKNSGPLVHPVMAPPSMSPIGGVIKLFKRFFIKNKNSLHVCVNQLFLHVVHQNSLQ